MVAQVSPGGRAAVNALPDRLSDALARYPWPGNVKELENLARGYAVSPDSEQLIAELARRSQALNVPPVHFENGLSLKEQVRRASKQLESQIILKALERHRWNRRRAAQTLKISYRALLYKMKDSNLRAEAEPD